MGNDDLELACGCKHSSVSKSSVTLVYDWHNTCPLTPQEGASLPAPLTHMLMVFSH